MGNRDDFGLIVDNHYSESTLKLLVGRGYRRYEKWDTTARALPRKDVLSSLLMHGKFYLPRPYWLNERELTGLDTYVSEDLIGWIPDDAYTHAFDRLSSFNTLLQRVIKNGWDRKFVSFDDPTPGKTLSELDISASELHFDLNIHTNKLLFSGPTISSNLAHRRVDADPLYILHRPLYEEAPLLVPDTAIISGDLENPEWGSYMWALNSDGSPREELISRFEDHRDGEEFLSNQATVYDSILSSLAIESFASETGLPIRTNAASGIECAHATVFGDEAYQLVKVQFESLRYPVIESIDDVLRLRESRHFETYRNVIAEYSARLRRELEEERGKVLDEFKLDLRLSTQSLYRSTKWTSRVADWSFYVSIPLAVIGIATGFPLSDAIIIPVTGAAKYVADSKRKELDWIMFGKS